MIDWTIVGAYALGGFFVYSMIIYGWHKLLNKKINFKDYKLYLSIIILIVLGTVINYLAPNYFKMLLMIILFFVLNYILIARKLAKCIMLVTITQAILIICETLFVVIMAIFIGDNMTELSSSPNGILLINISVSVLMFLFLRLPFPYKIYNYVSASFDNMRSNRLISYFVATIILSFIFLVLSYIPLPTPVVVSCNTLLVFFYAMVIIKMVNAQEKLRKVTGKYETSLTSLKEYEHIMDRYRVDNHENKNELLRIRNMVKANDNNVFDHIDKIVGDKINDNENIFYKTSKIPEGGLRATIYCKVCKMEELNINYVLNIASDVSTVELINIGANMVLDACKVIGVFLDNAIEAVENLTKKNIWIDLYVMDEQLCIDIKNNYEGELISHKLDKPKYTTKGDGHGYGLTLVKKIIDSDDSLKNERQLTRDIFIQRLKIKL